MKKEDMKKQKNLVIFAGVNGAGKSTAYEIDPCLANNLPIINPDVYAKEMANKVGARSINDLPPNLQTKVNIKAGKLALIKREKALKEGLSFGIETTASSDSIFRLIDKAHKLDYLVNLVYVMLPNEYVHIKRVSQRVRVGGHNVNSEDIKRRFSRATILFPKLLSKSDIAHVFDNTTNYKLALEKENGNIKIYPCNEEINKRLQDAVIKTKNLTSKNIEQNTAQKEIGHTSFLHSKHNSKDIER